MSNLCLEDPKVIFDTKMCLHAVSKNLEGDFNFVHREGQRCQDPECKTRKMRHHLIVSPAIHTCDSPLGHLLGGELRSEDFTTVFEGSDGDTRGFHIGNFKWLGPGNLFVIAGTMSGITNAGTHRPPVFSPCQTCDEIGFMEGRLCGKVIDWTDPTFKECQLIGTYRLLFDPATLSGPGTIEGTFEGSLWCPCGHT